MPVNAEEYIRLQGEIIEQQKMHIQSQDARILEQEQTIAELRGLVDELRLLKAAWRKLLRNLSGRCSAQKANG